MKPIIFLVQNDTPILNEVFRFLLQFVQPEKRERILRQRIKQNADNMLIGDILAKFAVKNVFAIDIAKQRIGYGEFGKPYLLDYPDIHFNISHSGEYVVCAVCDIPIGIDIQEIKPYNPNVAKKICLPFELKQIEQSTDKASEFIKLWTRKEAALKAKGTGIAGAIDEKYLIGTKTQSVQFFNYWLSYAMHI